MSRLLEKALEKVVALPQDEQDAIASQILASLADEDAWKMRFAEKRDVIRRIRGSARGRWPATRTTPESRFAETAPTCAFRMAHIQQMFEVSPLRHTGPVSAGTYRVEKFASRDLIRIRYSVDS